MSDEPEVIEATIRDALDADGLEELHIECRFSDGQKFAPIVVKAEFPVLANLIAEYLNHIARP